MKTHFVAVSLLLCGFAGAAERPNVVLMMADDLGWRDVGFNGGTTIKGKTKNVPVHEYVKVFLTEPVSAQATKPPKLSIYGEVLGSAGGNGGGAGSPGGTFRDVVQLYR